MPIVKPYVQTAVYPYPMIKCQHPCKHNASVDFDGELLCKQHAGQAALQLLMEETVDE